MKTLTRRVGALEDLIQRYGDDAEYVADLGDGRYYVDGQEVDGQTFRRRAPGPFVVDIGEDDHATE